MQVSNKSSIFSENGESSPMLTTALGFSAKPTSVAAICYKVIGRTDDRPHCVFGVGQSLQRICKLEPISAKDIVPIRINIHEVRWVITTTYQRCNWSPQRLQRLSPRWFQRQAYGVLTVVSQVFSVGHAVVRQSIACVGVHWQRRSLHVVAIERCHLTCGATGNVIVQWITSSCEPRKSSIDELVPTPVLRLYWRKATRRVNVWLRYAKLQTSRESMIYITDVSIACIQSDIRCHWVRRENVLSEPQRCLSQTLESPANNHSAFAFSFEVSAHTWVVGLRNSSTVSSHTNIFSNWHSSL